MSIDVTKHWEDIVQDYAIHQVSASPASIFADGYTVDINLDLYNWQRMVDHLTRYKALADIVSKINQDPELSRQFEEIKTLIKLKND